MNKLPLKVTPEAAQAAIAYEFYFNAAHGVEGARTLGNLHTTAFDTDTLKEMAPDPAARALNSTWLCLLILRTGTKVIGVNYGAVDWREQDEVIARQKAKEHAMDQVFELLTAQLRAQQWAQRQQVWATEQRNAHHEPVPSDNTFTISHTPPPVEQDGEKILQASQNLVFLWQKEQVSINDRVDYEFRVHGPMNGDSDTKLTPEDFSRIVKNSIVYLQVKDPLVTLFAFHTGHGNTPPVIELDKVTPPSDDYRITHGASGVFLRRQEDGGQLTFISSRVTPLENTLSWLKVAHTKGAEIGREYTHMWRMMTFTRGNSSTHQINLSLGSDAIILFQEESHNFVRAHLQGVLSSIHGEALKRSAVRPEEALPAELWDFLWKVEHAADYYLSFREGMLDDKESAALYQKLAEAMRDPNLRIDEGGIWVPVSSIHPK